MTDRRAPHISYIVPCYNARAYLQQCLESISSMTSDTYEVLVVDDGSTEDIRDIVEQFAPEARYIRQENQGAAAARNTGIAASSGTYLRFLDADDYLLSAETLAKQIAMLDADDDLGLVYGQSVKVDQHGTRFGLRAPSFASDSYVRDGCEELFELLVWNYITMSTVVARRSAIVAVGMFRTDLRAENGRSRTNEDHECWINVAKIARVGYLAEPVAAYRVHAGGVSVRKTLPQLYKEMEALDRFFADAAFAQKYAHVLPAIDRRRTRNTARVAYRNGDMRLVRRKAPIAMVHALQRRQLRRAAGLARLYASSFLPASSRH